jgi:protein tyrosine/serine phosphatase
MGSSAWAASAPGINNFYQIDNQVYRGAQPTAEGFHYLATLGVKVVLDLREHDSRAVAEERTVTAAGMRYINVPMTGMTPPTDSEVKTILALLEDETAGPVFVHCKRGADRTGAVIASYRIDHDKWDGKKALQEAMADHMSGFQFQRQKFIKTFQGRTAAVASSQPDATVDATPTPKPAAAGN